MKVKVKLLSFIMFLLLYINLSLNIETPDKIKNNIEDDVMVHVTTNNTILDIELEEYLVGVVSAEMPASFELEALKAQAVVARSFVYSRKLKVDDSTNTQVYHDDEKLREKWKSKYDEYIKKIKEAVYSTKGEVIVYDDEIIRAYFFASSNGYTNNSEDYWTNALAYLRSVESIYDEIKIDKVTYSKEELNKLFNMNVNTIKIKSYYDNGYVNEVLINNKIYSGKEVREICKLKSSSFTIEFNDTIIFHTKGYGHGVGMSQYGAQGMALAGYNYIDIIKHYYQGVEIMNK